MQNLARYLLKDFMYQQDDNTRYIFHDGKFVFVDRDDVADAILIAIDAVFERYLDKDIFLSIDNTYDPYT